MKNKPVAVIIMDGFGLRDEQSGNAIAQAKTPNYDTYIARFPFTTLTAAGEDVGLPEGQMGNSEVGHLNIGAGRTVYQSLTRINLAIREGDLHQNNVLNAAFNQAKVTQKKVHIMGLLSDGGVHSHKDHMTALVRAAKENGVSDVFIHGFLDGRDTAPNSALEFMGDFETDLERVGMGTIATVSGRYFAMDRDKNYDRTQKAYDVMTTGEGKQAASATEGISASYEEGIFDEFVVPFVVNEAGLIEDDDVVIFANFRPDRARQIAMGLSNPEGVASDMKTVALDVTNGPKNLHFVSMMSYGEGISGSVAFEPVALSNTYGEVIASNGLKQLRIAETEKYAHVTFFFDGGTDKELVGATRVLIDSPKVATYDLKPEMSAYEVRSAAIDEINKGIHDTIVLNFANPDMVGHSGDLAATIRAVEVVDECLGQVVEAILAKGGVAIITADHGNAELMESEAGGPHTAHTANLVPMIITKEGICLRDGGSLCDIAPTMLDLLGVDQPEEMTGKSLIK